MIILLSGGGGRLGTELKKLLIHTDSSRPARTITLIAPGIGEWDITKLEDCIRVLKKYKPDAVVHAAAYTNVAKAEEEKDVCRRINVAGTANVANAIKEVHPPAHLIYISTDYVFGGDKGNYKEEDATRPVNFYALTKLEGEREASRVPHYHIIRTSFKPRPFEHPKAAQDMWTSADYVDIIAKELALGIAHYQLLPKVIHTATERKSVFALAKLTNPKVEPIKRADIKSVILPKDTSLDITSWRELKTQIAKRKSTA